MPRRDAPTRVQSTRHGLGLYRKQGRDGFFFIKNLSAQAKLYPGQIQPKYIDEWIKRADGTMVTSQKEAESYCHRRNGQIQEMLLTLAGDTVDYSGADLEGIAQQLANQWISAAQRGLNLQDMDSTVLQAFANTAAGGKGHHETEDGKVLFAEIQLSEREKAFYKKHPQLEHKPFVQQTREERELLKEFLLEPITLDDLDVDGGIYVIDKAKLEEGRKLEHLCWDNGFRPTENGLNRILERFSDLVKDHMEIADVARVQGRLKAPKPALEEKSTTWQRLLGAKEVEGVAVGTLAGMTKAAERLEGWTKANYSLHLPGAIDDEVAKQYRSWLFSGDSGLSSSSVSKEVRYLNSIFNASVRQGLLDENPFRNLPEDRRAAMQQQVDARKTVDSNKVISPEEARSIYERMNSDKRGNRDSAFDLFYLQTVTGTRIQEVAGLRRCDFTERKFDGKTYKCIEIVRWNKRGIAVLGERGGLKTPQSERIVPLPKCAEEIWNKHAGPKSKEPAFPKEEPKTERAHWGDNLARRMRDKIPDFPGTHAWRETLINHLLNSAVPARIVEMVTGKTGNTPLSQYTSDDLPSMARAIELHAAHLALPAYKGEQQ
ncbi:tyrosine-type recombinase/integrase [Synechococcus sp. MIT S1220]|uniref:tyrosine-type recombinase/integrase n=1 Tax=Synechococcus sp. MIT S1220 TaxID=3082549 RepID=UPI0039AEF8DE